MFKRLFLYRKEIKLEKKLLKNKLLLGEINKEEYYNQLKELKERATLKIDNILFRK